MKVQLGDQRDLFDEKSSRLRWFILPSEVLESLSSPNAIISKVTPFEPLDYTNDKDNKSTTKKILASVKIERYSDSSLAKKQANDSQKSLIDYFEGGFKDKSTVNVPDLPAKSSLDDYIPPEKKEKIVSCPLRTRKRKSSDGGDSLVLSKWYSPPKSIFKPMLQVRINCYM